MLGSLPLLAYSSFAFSESNGAALDSLRFQLTLSALRASRVASTVSPTTATPKGRGMTFVTPLIFMTSSLLMPSALAPSIGVCRTVAYTMPGTCTSMPYVAVPLTLEGTSTRPMSLRPINRNCDGFLRSSGLICGSSAGTVANLATSP